MFGLTLGEKVTIGTALLGGMAGVVGSFAVLRGRALVGDMLSHAALPGVCLAFLFMESRNLLGLSFGALASGLLAVGAVTLIVRWTRTKQDAAIGIVLSTFFGAGVVLLSVVAKSDRVTKKAGIDHYIFGEPANILTSDLYLLIGVALVVILTVIVCFKEFQIVCFDQDFAQTQGWPTLALDLAMMSALTVVTIVGLPIVGVILMAAMIILPAATARFWTNRLQILLLLSGAFGVASGVIGTQVGRRIPAAGASIVLSAAAMFLVSLLFAPQRGVVARIYADWQLRKRIAREHLLRSLYELGESELPELVELPIEQLRNYRYWGPRAMERLLNWAVDDELVKTRQDVVQLTPLGLKRGAELTKAHRLWEMYLMEYADIASDHVDRDADETEHLLPDTLLIELEKQLSEEGRMPQVVEEVPVSPHELDAGEET